MKKIVKRSKLSIKVLILLMVMLCTANLEIAYSQLFVTPALNNVNAKAIVNSYLPVNGITISNVTYSGQFIDSSGTITGGQIGSFITGSDTTNLGILKGIIMSNGNVSRAIKPNVYDGYGNYSNSEMNYYNYFCECETLNGDVTCLKNLPGCQWSDADLDAIEGCTPSCTYDATSLEFDIIPSKNQVSIRYVFASDEYPDYVCSTVNDIFAIFVTGPNPAGGNYIKKNIALIPGTNEPVSINTINSGVCGQNFVSHTGVDLNNSQYYVDNKNGQSIVYNGFTKVMTAKYNVMPHQKYHIKIAIADVVDGAFDSSIFIEDLSSDALVLSLNTDGVCDTCNTCNNGYAWVNINGGTPPYSYEWNTVPIQITDTAKNLTPGNYKVCVSDSNGNRVCDSIKINMGNSIAHFILYPTSTPHVYQAVNMSSGATPLRYLWSWGDGNYDTAAYPTHTYDTAGYYKICLTITDNAGCSNTYCYSSLLTKSGNTIIQVNVIPNSTGINHNNIEKAFYIYPNPASDIFTIENKDNVAQNYVVSIKNMQGLEVLKQCIEHSVQCIVNVSGLSDGVYIVTISNNELGIKNYKLVISR